MISVYVCLFTCLSVYPLAYLKNHTSKFRQILCTCYMWPWLGLSLTALRYVTDFVDDVIFPYNGGHRLESNTTRMFRPVLCHIPCIMNFIGWTCPNGSSSESPPKFTAVFTTWRLGICLKCARPLLPQHVVRVFGQSPPATWLFHESDE